MIKRFFYIDWWLFAPLLILLIISLTTLFSIDVTLFQSQLRSVVVALIAFFFFAVIRYEALKQFAWPIYLFSLMALAVVLFLGFESHGAVRWIAVLGGQLQFSELCKPLLSIALATYLDKHENNQPKSLFIVLLALIPVVVLIYLQPDLGNALIYAFVTLFILLVYGYQLRWFAVSLFPILLSLPFIWVRLHDYQRQRILTFLHPSTDQSGASYNAMQALIAVGSGMLSGKGLSEGTQSALRFLPERHTDFIFATLTEELGFVGGVIVLTAFGFLLYRLYTLFLKSEDTYTKVILVATFSLILIHAFLNIGMNIGLVPIVGVTLPFVSFGGNSLLANCILLGLATAISKRVDKREVLEIS